MQVVTKTCILSQKLDFYLKIYYDCFGGWIIVLWMFWQKIPLGFVRFQ